MLKSFRGTVTKLIRRWVRGNVETTLPAKIIDISTYEQTQQIAVVQPLTNLFFEDDQFVEMPYIYNVPVELTGTLESLISVPLKVGDTVTLKFSKRSLSELKQQAIATTYTPADKRWFDTADAVAFPTVLNKASSLSPSADHVEIKHKDILTSYQADGTILETNGEITRTFSPDGTIDIVNSNMSMNITPSGVYTYSSGAVSFVISPDGSSVTVTAPTTTFNGNVVVTGTTTSTGTVSGGAIVTTGGADLDDLKEAHDTHWHNGSHGSTDTPQNPP